MTFCIKKLTTNDLLPCLTGLTEILHATVQSKASVGFILPFSLQDSRAFWTDNIFPSVKRGERILLSAELDNRIAGTAQLVTNMPANQAHRCEVAKLLVHPDFRRQGIAMALMNELEVQARELGKELITLDTRTGDTAEPLYQSLGYQTAGIIPGFCRAPDTDCYDSTTYMFKAF